MLKDKPTLYNIPAGLPFADCLAEGVLHLYGNRPDILAKTTIFLPSKRGIRALREAFYRRRSGKLMLLPSLRALGDGLDAEPSLLAEDAVSASYLLSQKQVISGGVRQLALTKLILEHIRPNADGDMSYAHALALAVSLTELLDSVQSERIEFQAIRSLDVEGHALSWQQNIDILHIITDIWPDYLAMIGRIDPVSYRNAILEILTQHWQNHPPAYPIIAAGSTGSMPASADFMRLIGRLPQGCVVLPGLDPDLTEADIQALTSDHPQCGLSHLLSYYQMTSPDIDLWCATKDFMTDHHRAKRKFFHEIMRPSGTAEAWFNINERLSQEDVHKAIEGLHILSAKNEREEATAIALIMREALETPHKTVALVTPNRILARHVKTALKRWGIVPDDSAGVPLSDLPQGIFFKLLCDVLDTNFAPVSFLSLLKHPFACAGLSPPEFRSKIRLLENAILRGVKPKTAGLSGYRVALMEKIQELQKSTHDSQEKIDSLNRLFGFLDLLEECFAPLVTLPDISTMQDFIDKLIVTLEKLSLYSTSKKGYLVQTLSFWSDEAGRCMESLLAEFADNTHLLGTLPQSTIRQHIMEYSAKLPVRPSHGLNHRLFIWGTPEARLQQTDILILGGLTEESWPISPNTGIFLSRPMRKTLGLSSPERRIGLSAHDFVQAGCSPHVYMTHSLRSNGKPLTPSRWLIRLENLLKGAVYKDETGKNHHILEKLHDTPYLAWANMLDMPDGFVPPAKRPMPTPPVHVRPRRLPVTHIEKWVRDPYFIYAYYILKLRSKDPIDADIEAKDKGNILHKVSHFFVQETKDCLDNTAPHIMNRLIDDVLSDMGEHPSVLAFWKPRLQHLSKIFIREEFLRRKSLHPMALEVSGALTFTVPYEDFTITARADRIDRDKNGHLVIIDYKSSLAASGTAAQIEAGLAPQLPLQAMIARYGGFEGIEPSVIAGLEYIILSGAKKNPYLRKEITLPKKTQYADFSEMLLNVEEGFKGWVTRFDDVNTPYTSRLMPQLLSYIGDYDQLARVQEWSQDEDAEE